MKNEIKTLQDRIKFLREDKKLNQTSFGDKIGVTTSTVSGYESGRRIPNEAILKSICREFNVSRAWLLDGVGDMYNNTDTDLLDQIEKLIDNEDEFYKSLLRTIVDLNDEDLMMFKNIVDSLAKKNKN